MILDNVDDTETFAQSQKFERKESSENPATSLLTYLPQCRNGSILVTSRNKDAAERVVGGYEYIKEIFAMGESEASQLLHNKLNKELKGDIIALLRALGYMPLAITQAAAYINRRAHMNITRYLADLHNENKREDLLTLDRGDLRRDKSASNSIVTTWQLSFEQIRRQRRSAGDLLSLMSFFNSQNIPEMSLREFSRLKALENGANEFEEEFYEDLDTLQAYCLIQATIEPGMFEMHPLVQFCTRVWLSSSHTTEQWRQTFFRLLVADFPSTESYDYEKHRKLFPHVEQLFESEPATELAEDWAEVLTRAAGYINGEGRCGIAKVAAEKALAVRERLLVSDNIRTLHSVGVLSGIFLTLGKYREAERLGRRAIYGLEKTAGLQHPFTISCSTNLASTLYCLGNFDEAERLHRQTLEACEQSRGRSHRITLSVASNLSGVLEKQMKYTEAEDLGRSAFGGLEKQLGRNDKITQNAMVSLAFVLHSQGKDDEAERLYRQALKEPAEYQSYQHPFGTLVITKLANLLCNQQRYKEAEELGRCAVALNEKNLGNNHPTTLLSTKDLARTLQEQHKFDEAEKLYRRIVDVSERC